MFMQSIKGFSARVLIVIGATLGVSGFAEVTVLADDNVEAELQQLLQAAPAEFKSIDATAMTSARNQLVKAMNELEKYLNASGPDVAAGWFRYLGWEKLQEQLARGAQGPDIAVLDELVSRYFKSYDGLDNQAFLKMRQQLRTYRAYSRLHYAANPRQDYLDKLEAMRRLIAGQKLRSLDVETVQELSHIHGWLVEGGQAVRVTQRLRQAFAHNNAQVNVRSSVIGDEPVVVVDERSPIRESILGAQVSGRAHTEATGRVIFYPNKQTADVRMELKGNTKSSSVARQGRVAVNTSGTTSIFAYKRLGFDGEKFFAYPADVQCNTRSTITSVSAPPLIRRIAWRRAQKMKPQGDRIASQRTSEKVAGELNQQMQVLLAQANTAYALNFHKPLVRLGFQPMLGSSSTTRDVLQANFLFARNDDLGSATPPPAPLGKSNIEASLHESSLANTLDILLAGLKIADQDAASLAETVYDDVPEELRIDLRDDDWYLVLTDKSPLLLRFQDGNRLSITVSAQRFVRREVEEQNGPKQVAENIRLDVLYVLDPLQNGWLARRVNGVKITSPEAIDPDLLRFMQEKAGAFFAAEINVKRDIIPEGLLSFKVLLNSLSMQGGWLRLGADYIR